MATITKPAEMTIAEAAAEAGVTVHTIRYYERAGLLTSVERNGSGHRRFAAEDVEWVVVVKKLRATGMPIRRIRDYAELVVEGEGQRATTGWRCSRRTARTCSSASNEIRRNLELIDYKIGLYRGKLGDG